MQELEKLSKRDMETYITYNEQESTAVVYTSNKAFIRELDKLCKENKSIKCTRTTCYGKTYRLPKAWVSVLSGCGSADKQRKKKVQQ